MAFTRRTLALPLAALVIVAVAGCVQTPKALPTSKPTATPTSSSTAVALPAYNPKGSASDNLAYFNKVGGELFASDQATAASTQGVVIVNWFVARGFDKANMEITPDKTAIGLAAWNIDFSVKFGTTCILGQAGNVGFQSSTVPILATGKCLIGQTRPINW